MTAQPLSSAELAQYRTEHAALHVTGVDRPCTICRLLATIEAMEQLADRLRAELRRNGFYPE